MEDKSIILNIGKENYDSFGKGIFGEIVVKKKKEKKKIEIFFW